MTNPTSAEVFKAELLPGETLEWTGRPNPSVIFHQEDWVAIPFSLLWGGFAIVWLLGASGLLGTSRSGNFGWFGVIWGTPFVVVGQYFIWGRFLYRRWDKKRTYYGLTSQRALVVRRGTHNQTCTSAYFESLPLIDKAVRSDRIGSIAFGGPVPTEWPWSRGNSPRPLTFEDVDDADSVYRTAISLHQNVRKTASASGTHSNLEPL